MSAAIWGEPTVAPAAGRPPAGEGASIQVPPRAGAQQAAGAQRQGRPQGVSLRASGAPTPWAPASTRDCSPPAARPAGPPRRLWCRATV